MDVADSLTDIIFFDSLKNGEDAKKIMGNFKKIDVLHKAVHWNAKVVLRNFENNFGKIF